MAALPFKVKAVYEYTSEHDDDLTFPIGQVITVTELEGDDWYVGEYTDVAGSKHDGLFPSNFVEKYEPEIPARPSRPTRPKQEVQQATPSAMQQENGQPPGLPATSKAQAPIVALPQAPLQEEASRDPPAAIAEPPPAPKPTAAEPAEPAPTSVKKAPPPIAAKSNAFKDRIAAFNAPAAAPLAPSQPGKQQPSSFIKKPFVAPPPSKNAYVPPPKAEPVHKPYLRDEDPEIREREEEDRAAAEAAGLGHDAPSAVHDDVAEDVSKPLTLKERMALLQKQQQEQAQRRAEATTKKKAPQKQASQSSEHGVAPEAEEDGLDRVRSDTTAKQSSEIQREKPRVPSTQRRPPEPTSPIPAVPDHEILSDGHEADQSGAGDLTEEEDAGTLGPDSDERPVEPPRQSLEGMTQRGLVDEPGAEGEDEDEEEDEVDEETRRREELRARMARLGGGMPGMGAPFNPFGAAPPPPSRRKQPAQEREMSGESAPSSPPQARQMIPVPGMLPVQSPESDTTQRIGAREEPEVEEDEEEPAPAPAPPSRASTIERSAPPVPRESRSIPPPPQERGMAPSVPSSTRPPAPDSRPVPPPPPATMSPGPGSESDDELSGHATADMSGVETPLPVRTGAPPVPGSRELPPRPPRSPGDKHSSYFGGSEPSSASSDKRSSRVAPPLPGSPLASPRPPPPPPPTQAPPSRKSTVDQFADDERVGSDYDGDYDTDIASSAKHKEALKAPHVREPSLTDNAFMDDTPVGSPAPTLATSAPRAVPPPPPLTAPKTRASMDRPPPVPPPRDESADEGYDPYRYVGGSGSQPPMPDVAPVAAPPMPPTRELYAEPEGAQEFAPTPRRSTERAIPPPPSDRVVSQPLPALQQPGNRASADVQRSATTARRSLDQQGRPSSEHGQIASDINLSLDTPWWTANKPLPPALQDRNGIDLLSECEETSKSKRGGKQEITKDIYILYIDYSQTVISARYDSQEPSEAHLEQRHEPPPARLRQDQLEAAWQRFGNKIADAANSLGHNKKDSLIGDGSPYSLPLELIKWQPEALLPVGTRAYGALVYANMANASTMQYDEIRRGDIITVRNARFEGHHGTMKTKYKNDYGPNHVAIVEEWDGTRRAVRAWEQGREKKGGVRSEKFRLGDLRSGEVRVWRVVGRDWVGWE